MVLLACKGDDHQRSYGTEYIPLEEHLFRYDRGGFWVAYSAFQYFLMPFNHFPRWYLDKHLRPRMLYTALHDSRHAKPYVMQKSRIVDLSCNGFCGVHRENIRNLSTVALPFASERIFYIPSTFLGEHD